MGLIISPNNRLMEMLSHIKAGKAREKSGRLVVLNAFSIDNIFSLQEVY